MARNFGTRGRRGGTHIAIGAGVAGCDERLKNCQSSTFKVERNAEPARRYEKLIHGLTHVKGLGTVGTMRHVCERSIYLIYSITLQRVSERSVAAIAAGCIFQRATARKRQLYNSDTIFL